MPHIEPTPNPCSHSCTGGTCDHGAVAPAELRRNNDSAPVRPSTFKILFNNNFSSLIDKVFFLVVRRRFWDVRCSPVVAHDRSDFPWRTLNRANGERVLNLFCWGNWRADFVAHVLRTPFAAHTHNLWQLFQSLFYYDIDFVRKSSICFRCFRFVINFYSS